MGDARDPRDELVNVLAETIVELAICDFRRAESDGDEASEAASTRPRRAAPARSRA